MKWYCSEEHQDRVGNDIEMAYTPTIQSKASISMTREHSFKSIEVPTVLSVWRGIGARTASSNVAASANGEQTGLIRSIVDKHEAEKTIEWNVALGSVLCPLQ